MSRVPLPSTATNIKLFFFNNPPPTLLPNMFDCVAVSRGTKHFSARKCLRAIFKSIQMVTCYQNNIGNQPFHKPNTACSTKMTMPKNIHPTVSLLEACICISCWHMVREKVKDKQKCEHHGINHTHTDSNKVCKRSNARHNRCPSMLELLVDIQGVKKRSK